MLSVGTNQEQLMVGGNGSPRSPQLNGSNGGGRTRLVGSTAPHTYMFHFNRSMCSVLKMVNSLLTLFEWVGERLRTVDLRRR